MIVYRDTTETVSGARVIGDLGQALGHGSTRLGAFLRAAEVECALADLNHHQASLAQDFTDRLCEAWLLDDARRVASASELLTQLVLPDAMTRRLPEGYAFYALDPANYAELARAFSARSRRAAVVLGLRSIGTSLSSVVQTELRRCGVSAARRTFRPSGHPWNRELEWSDADLAFLLPSVGKADFLVVDEGPGMSGSTFLSVGDALLGLGVPVERILFFCSREPDAERLLADDGATRWRRFTSYSAAAWKPPPGTLNLAGGAWRACSGLAESAWPASWTALERVKYAAPDRSSFVKFAGYAPYDEPVRKRADVLASEAWSPRARTAEPGFITYDWIHGRLADAARDRDSAIPIIARYLAFRARNLALAAADVSPMQEMLHVNVSEELKRELPPGTELEVRQPVAADARLLPHEWLVTARGQWMKTDATDHAADHLFPGPTDVAWDLAGAAVEWRLDRARSAALLAEYQRLTGDDASGRFDAYEAAYCAFRVGVGRYAEPQVDAFDARRWTGLIRAYRARLESVLERMGTRGRR